MGVFDKLTNKISHKINELVTDPKAEQIAAEKERAKAIEEKKEEEVKEKEQAAKEEEETAAEESKTDFQHAAAIAIKVFISIFGIFLILIFGSLVSNISIHRHVAIRLLYFIYGAIGGSILIAASIAIPPLMFIGIIIIALLYKFNKFPHRYAFMPLATTSLSDDQIGIIKSIFYWNPESPEHKSAYLEAINTYEKFLGSQLMKSAKK